MKNGSCKSLISALLLLSAGAASGAPLPQGEWRCVALTPRHLALTGDYSQLQSRLFRERWQMRKNRLGAKSPQWAWEAGRDIAGIEAIAAYRPQVVKMLRDAPAIGLSAERGEIAATGTGYWLSPIGQMRFNDAGKEYFLRCADVAHHLFLALSRPLADGEKLAITLPAGEKIDFTYRRSAPTPVFKINQVGYMPEARKFAYIGAWLGTAGALPLFDKFTGKTFRLIDDADGKAVFDGLLHPRPHDQRTASGTPFTGEEILELDITNFTKPGKYHLEVDDLGRSETFRIGDDTMAEAFYIHARGLYHQRCGIAREKPYTNWTLPLCHRHCIRGTFPPDDSHYMPGKNDRSYGFRSADGKSLKVNHFMLIRQNVPANPEVLDAPGGWHDAADWDRRPQHLEIVGDLCAVYLLKPDNFRDGQLNLPESGNGIPDILDEACWGIDHLRLKQQPDGGVGTWVETTAHPKPGNGSSAEDKMTYYLSCATRNSTLEYAAYAAELALALKRAGAEKRSEVYHDSARRAWDFALAPGKRTMRTFSYQKDIIFYRENPELDRINLVKAGFDLFQLSGDSRYIEEAERNIAAVIKASHKGSWNRSPLCLMELEVFPCRSAALEKLRRDRCRMQLSLARTMMRQLESNYPIRVPWYGVNEGWSHTMSWGTFHPLRRARALIAAHALSGDRNFLDGACLANDFHNGANPFGSSMTSGLGKVYPVRFLDLNSYADGIAEPMPGITPYRNTYGIPRDAVKMAFGLFYSPNLRQKFGGLSLSLLPREGLSESECAKELGKIYPIWHRWCNVESRTVAASEFTVWETIAPAAAVTGYLLNGAQLPEREWLERRPADDIRKLPGYAPLP